MEIGQLQDILSQVKFSKNNIHTPEMDIEIEGLCAAIIDFLMHALSYQKKWSFGELDPHFKNQSLVCADVSFSSSKVPKQHHR
jgi:hypothetical protein